MRTKTKPDFRPNGAFWVDPNFLPDSVIAELRPIVRRARLPEEQEVRFLNSCHAAAQIAAELRKTTPTKEVVEQLNRVESESRRLLVALSKLSIEAVAEFHSNFDYLAYGTESPITLADETRAMRSGEGRFLGAVWTFVSDLEDAAAYAASMCVPAATIKVGENNARRLVRFVADSYVRTVGRRPPYSKGTWFPDFMEKLGAAPGIEVTCRRDLVEGVIREHFSGSQ